MKTQTYYKYHRIEDHNGYIDYRVIECPADQSFDIELLAIRLRNIDIALSFKGKSYGNYNLPNLFEILIINHNRGITNSSRVIRGHFNSYRSAVKAYHMLIKILRK